MTLTENRSALPVPARGLLLAALVAMLAMATSCTQPAALPRFDAQLPATTDEGLRRLDHGRFAVALARPGSSFSNYHALRFEYSGIHYRTPPGPAADWGRLSNYPMPDETMARLMAGLEEIFSEAVQRDLAWQTAAEPGPGVLLARITLLDLVLTSPLRNLAGDTDNWSSSLGSFTLVVDLVDTETGVLIARAAERRSIQSQTIRPIQAAPGAATYESRRIFREWGSKLTSLLDGLRVAGL